MTTTSKCNRVIAYLAALALLLTMLPAIGRMTAAAQTSAVTMIADPVTMNDWQEWFGENVLSTENAGRIWTDKSVMTDASAFGDAGIVLRDENSFLVALSAIASNTVISGMTNIPTDMMLVLDTSDAAAVQTNVAAVNRLMAEMQRVNVYNRVGVTVYGADSTVLLPLGRYACADGESFVTATDSSVAVANGVTDAAGRAVVNEYARDASAEAYTQLGLLTALEQMLDADPVIPDGAAFLAGKARLPLVILISDSVPTAAALDYTEKQEADIRVAQDTAYGTAQVVFATQLTAAYVKTSLTSHYQGNTPLTYTLSTGNNRDITDLQQSDAQAQAVLAQPDSYDADACDKALINRAAAGYWQLLLLDGAVDITAPAADGQGTVTHTVGCVSGEEPFPSAMSDRYYVDRAFDRTEDNAVQTMLETIDVRSHYHPTLVTENADVSGYISFVDKIGQHMKVTDIKGILIDDTLCSGALLSKNFITGGGALGTFSDPKPLGDELVWAVQARIGVDADTARDLLGLAYAKGQLAYTDDTHFSNYIGWYANQNGEFLGFWYDGITSMPDPEDPSLSETERPAYIMKSYGYLGKVDERHGVTESDFMYATVQHRTDLLTGEEMIAFAVPASLIPVVNYEVTSETDGTPTAMQVSGADSPIRLVYEVSLDDAIDAVSVARVVGEEYPYRGEDGSYYFYTNLFEAEDHTGYGAVNTYSYFVPSTENARYYFTANETLYVDQNGTELTEQPQNDQTYYRAVKVFEKEDVVTYRTVYEAVSPASLSRARQHTDGTWYVPEGTVRTMLDDYISLKANNATGTLSYSYIPFVDAQYTYYVGATLGNSGRIAVKPETGLCIMNTVSDDNTDVFSYHIARTDLRESKTYRARFVKADGKTDSVSVTFTDGEATVSLADGEAIWIYGMREGASYHVTQETHPDYRTDVVNDTVTLKTAKLESVSFTNTRKGFGNLTITNRVAHEFDSTYEMPDKVFTFYADLGKRYANQTVAAAHSADPALTCVTADPNGRVTFSLRHTEQFELIGLVEGTAVTVTQPVVPEGFTATFYGVGEQGQNTVSVAADASVSMVVLNRYQAEAIHAAVTVGGTVSLVGRDVWTEEDVYSFELQRHNGQAWETVSVRTADARHTAFDFNDAMGAERFTKPGVYSYQIIQTVADVKGVVYDRGIHTFSVTVGDPDMTGLRVTDVSCHRNSDIVIGNAENGWGVLVDFENHYSSHETVIAVDVVAQMQNDSESDIASREGFRYGLYHVWETDPTVISPLTDRLGETRMPVYFTQTGTYIYELRPIIPDVTEYAVRFDDAVYTVAVTVTEEDGHLTAKTVISKDGAVVSGPPVFYNRYELKPAQLTLNVEKKLVGRSLLDGEFAFYLKNGEELISVGHNRADGTVAFSQPIEFTKVGDYYYDVTEAKPTRPGVAADTTVYHLHIRVFDGGDGHLYTHHHVINSASDNMVFSGQYTAAPASLTLNGVTTLSGRELVNEEFQFLLAETEGEDPLMLTAANRTDGGFAFETLTFDKAGHYEFTVQEVKSSTTHGILFDDTHYTVNVTVTDDGNAQLHAVYTLRREGVPCESIVFENAYAPTPYKTVLTGTKTMIGRELREGECTFTLYRCDNGWNAPSVLQTTTNRADGSFAFDPVCVTGDGVYRYLIKEQHGGETLDGVSYDTQYYRVIIVATDNHRGKLEIEQILFDSTNTFCTAMTFVNVYTNEELPTTTTTTTETTTTVTVQTETSVTTATLPKAPQTGENGVVRWVLLVGILGIVTVLLTASRRMRTP